jgi:hypothetical protein
MAVVASITTMSRPRKLRGARTMDAMECHSGTVAGFEGSLL